MAEKGFTRRFLETKWFGLLIGLVVFGLMAGMTYGTLLISNLETKVLDFNFRMKNPKATTRIQEGVTVEETNPRISPDILIVGIDERALARFGRWPFPRYRHADLLNTFSRIRNQDERERALFLDIFFNEPDGKAPQDDAAVVDAIRENGRVFLETVLQREEYPEMEGEGPFDRQEVLAERFGTITRITGDWKKVDSFLGMKPPLSPYTRATYGYGHANYVQDEDQVYRRASLVARASQLVEEIPLDELSVDTKVDTAAFERLSWRDTHNVEHDIPWPPKGDDPENEIAELRKTITSKAPPATEEDRDGDGTVDRVTFVVRKYRETWLPSIALALAAEYLNVKLSDVEVKLGEHILIPSPKRYNSETKALEPYSIVTRPAKVDEATGAVVKAEQRKVLTELRIPIDEHGQMLINFMGYPSSATFGSSSTYPVRSYSRYASSPPGSDPEAWDDTLGMANKIVMLGAFAQGMAEDQKPTPFGLMFGVEIHANALNTILMGNFLRYAPFWLSILILFGMVMLTAFMTSRLSTVWSLVALVVALVAYFGVVLVLFDFNAYILTLSAPVFGSFLCFLAVVAYRTVFEERDKRRNKAIFSKMVGPAVLKEILEHPPEPGGRDKSMTVFFSDIRGFSSISERMAAQELLNFLNKYLTIMADTVKDYNGTIDKYIGDAVMGYWGAPVAQDDHALLACKCALKQMENLKIFNAMWSENQRIDIGIGISTGIMTVGLMGSRDHLNYTVIGDAVNLGSRLEGANKAYYDVSKGAGHYSRILISELTYAEVKDKVIARELDVLKVKGKEQPSIVYELIDVEGGYEPPKPPASKGKMLAAEAAADRRERAEKARGEARTQKKGQEKGG
ncbi:MAG: adenylate/guanylate cyclase domain-containing protein [Spirochaetes bacterium]|nr:adenylate/guanylate cyclase domain-containing protein [Spirochaetota bacterium]